MDISRGNLSLYPRKTVPFVDPKSHIIGLELPQSSSDILDNLDFTKFIDFARDEEIYECFRRCPSDAQGRVDVALLNHDFLFLALQGGRKVSREGEMNDKERREMFCARSKAREQKI